MKRNRYLTIAALILGATSLAFGEVDGWIQQTPNKQKTAQATCCPGCGTTQRTSVTLPKTTKGAKNPFWEPKEWTAISNMEP